MPLPLLPAVVRVAGVWGVFGISPRTLYPTPYTTHPRSTNTSVGVRGRGMGMEGQVLQASAGGSVGNVNVQQFGRGSKRHISLQRPEAQAAKPRTQLEIEPFLLIKPQS